MLSRLKKHISEKKSQKQDPLTADTTSSAAASTNSLPQYAADSPPQSRQPPINVENPTTHSAREVAAAPAAPSQSEQCANERVTRGSSGTAAEPTHRKTFEELFPSGDTLGLRVLYTPTDTSNTLVDIVFVHGLTGNSYNTWLEANSGTYWPVHLLRQSVPNARIMAFGYDADVAKFLGPVSQNNLRDHASTLLGDLARIRRKTDSVRTSLVRRRQLLTGHSRSIER
jgi:hypothetical protein